jgi:hypothetical protein
VIAGGRRGPEDLTGGRVQCVAPSYIANRWESFPALAFYLEVFVTSRTHQPEHWTRLAAMGRALYAGVRQNDDLARLLERERRPGALLPADGLRSSWRIHDQRMARPVLREIDRSSIKQPEILRV